MQDLTDCKVIEIGPGRRPDARPADGRARKVHVIEADSRFIPALQEIAHLSRQAQYCRRRCAQIRPKDLTDGPFRIVSNLPYNIGTALLTGWLDRGWSDGIWQPSFLSMTLMFQKEVAQRITAQAGDKHYGRLAVLANWLCDADLAFELDRQVFVPPPKVTSAIAHLVPRAQPMAEADPEVLKTDRCSFWSEAEMLRASLKQICSDAQAIMAEAGIDETARAEVLTIDDFCKLARLLPSYKVGEL